MRRPLMLAIILMAIGITCRPARAQADGETCKDMNDMSQLIKTSNALNAHALGDDCPADMKTIAPWKIEMAQKYKGCASFFIDQGRKRPSLGKLVSDRIRNDISALKKDSPFLKTYPEFTQSTGNDPALCPGFGSFSEEAKVEFWNWLFEILAFNESSCDPTKKNYSKGVPRPPAAGLYQLEQAKSLRAWRGTSCAVSSDQIMTADGNTACAFTILRSQLVNNGHLFGVINGENHVAHHSYWYSLNQLKPPRNSQYRQPHNLLVRDLQAFPGCKK